MSSTFKTITLMSAVALSSCAIIQPTIWMVDTNKQTAGSTEIPCIFQKPTLEPIPTMDLSRFPKIGSPPATREGFLVDYIEHLKRHDLSNQTRWQTSYERYLSCLKP